VAVQPGDVSVDMLVRSLAASAAVHLGDVVDRATGAKATPNPAAAAQMIDLLALLERKTQGNLDEAESQVLAETLRVLRARLLEVRQRVAAGAAPGA
jgi:hypothetical protein|tara:strand:+ start:752 stop:1042 length:291 start_codon:yes stop_codon:yes gene_type:complete